MAGNAEVSGNHAKTTGGGVYIDCTPTSTFIFAGGTIYGRNGGPKANGAEDDLWTDDEGGADADAAYELSPYTTTDALFLSFASGMIPTASQVKAVWGDGVTPILDPSGFTDYTVGTDHIRYYVYSANGTDSGSGNTTGRGYGGTIKGGYNGGTLDPD
jgi:hypothetical protein